MIDSDFIEENLRFAKVNKLDNFLISARIGNYKLKDINFLIDYPQIEKLYISVYEYIDYQIINSLQNLHTLSIDVLANDNQKIDFSNFPKLEKLSFDWRLKEENLDNVRTLRYLTIGKFKKKDLTYLSKLNKIESLGIFQSQIKSLNGINELTNLKKLCIVLCPKLSKLDGISACENLEELIIANAKNINDINELSKLKKLRKIRIESCGNIEIPINKTILEKIELVGATAFI